MISPFDRAIGIGVGTIILGVVEVSEAIDSRSFGSEERFGETIAVLPVDVVGWTGS